MTPEQIKCNLEMCIDNRIPMDTDDIQHVYNLIREYEMIIDNLERRIEALNATNRLLMRSQDNYAAARVQEFALGLQTYYTTLSGMAFPPLVQYHINEKLKMFLEKLRREAEDDGKED